MSVCKSIGHKKWGGNDVKLVVSLLIVHQHLLLVQCVAANHHSRTVESNLAGVVRIFGCVFSCTVQKMWGGFQQPPPLKSHPRLLLLHRVTPDHHPNSWYGRHFPVCQSAKAGWRPAGRDALLNRVRALSLVYQRTTHCSVFVFWLLQWALLRRTHWARDTAAPLPCLGRSKPRIWSAPQMKWRTSLESRMLKQFFALNSVFRWRIFRTSGGP